jgi:hypothetical protein
LEVSRFYFYKITAGGEMNLKKVVHSSVWFFQMASFLLAGDIIYMTPDTLNYGEVTAGQIIRGQIKFINDRTESVQISRVNTSCGCTVAETDKKIYSPGEMATISFVLNTRGFKGLISKAITIDFENNNPPSKTFKISAKCIDYLDIQPRVLTFLNIKVNKDTTVQQAVHLINKYKNPIVIRSIHTDADVRIDFKKTEIAPGDDYIFRVLLKPGQEYQKNTQIFIESDSESMEPIRLPLYISVRN